jgi:hypothetical protein
MIVKYVREHKPSAKGGPLMVVQLENAVYDKAIVAARDNRQTVIDWIRGLIHSATDDNSSSSVKNGDAHSDGAKAAHPAERARVE